MSLTVIDLGHKAGRRHAVDFNQMVKYISNILFPTIMHLGMLLIIR